MKKKAEFKDTVPYRQVLYKRTVDACILVKARLLYTHTLYKLTA